MCLLVLAHVCRVLPVCRSIKQAMKPPLTRSPGA